MNHPLLRIVGVFLLVLCGIAGAMQNQDEATTQAPGPENGAAGSPDVSPAVDEEAEQVLSKLSSFYRGLQQGQVKVTSVLAMSQFGQEMTLDVDSTFVWQRPNQFALWATSARLNGTEVPVGEYSGETVSDGKELYLFAPMLNTYIQRDAPASFDALVEGDPEMAFLSASGGSELQVLIGLLSDEPLAQLTDHATALRYAGQETIDGRALHHIRIESDDVDVHLWIDCGDEPWLYRAQPDFQKYYDRMAVAAGEAPGQPVPQLSFTYTGWSTQLPAEDAFAFKPPAGAERRDTFYQEPAPPRRDAAQELVGHEAPDFALPLLGGGALDPAELRGKQIVILDFWATWCAPCRRALPIVAEVAGKYRDQGVRLFAVNIAEAEDRVQGFVDSMKYTFDVALDREGKVADRFKVTGIPQTVIIGKNGVVQAVHTGFRPDQMRQELTEELEALLRGENLFSAPEKQDAATADGGGEAESE
jgi:peroxiredoxin